MGKKSIRANASFGNEKQENRKLKELTHLIKSVLWYNFDPSQVAFGIHKNDTNRPKGKAKEDTKKGVDPNGCTSDA